MHLQHVIWELKFTWECFSCVLIHTTTFKYEWTLCYMPGNYCSTLNSLIFSAIHAPFYKVLPVL